jgi:hypothetical protein
VVATDIEYDGKSALEGPRRGRGENFGKMVELGD